MAVEQTEQTEQPKTKAAAARAAASGPWRATGHLRYQGVAAFPAGEIVPTDHPGFARWKAAGNIAQADAE